MLPSPRYFPRLMRSFAIMTVLASATAVADSGGRKKTPPPPPQYLEECAACHAAFQPRMLPAASWQRLMTTLPTHFGTDASLDAAVAHDIAFWLVANAGAAKRFPAPPPEDRITRSRWFTRQHHEISATTWRREAIKTPANCTACHRTADQGVFNEHDVRIPK